MSNKEIRGVLRKSIFLVFMLTMVTTVSCGDSYQINRLKKEQFAIVNENVQEILGKDYYVREYHIIQEGYLENKTQYLVEFKFDLNKSAFLFIQKEIPGKLLFQKEKGGWICVLNTGVLSQYFK